MAQGAVYNLTPQDDWMGLLHGKGLSPGDEVILHAGTYVSTRRMNWGHRGTAANPILIRAAAGEKVTITRNNRVENVINIEGGQYLTLRGFEITNGHRGVAIGQDFFGDDVQAKYITLERNYIHDVNHIGVSANYTTSTYEGMVFRRNEVHSTGGVGEGFYLGANQPVGGPQELGIFHHGIVEGNYVHHTNGPNVDQGDGIEIKDGGYHNVIRNNVIHDTNYPGITTYGTGNKGPEHANIIEGNVVWNSRYQGIQAGPNVVVRNNIVYNARYEAFQAKNISSSVAGVKVDVTGNTFIGTNQWNRLVDIHASNLGETSVVFANNALYGAEQNLILWLPNNPNKVTVKGNVGAGGVTLPALPASAWDGSGDLAEDITDPAGLNFFPLAAGALVGAGDAAYMPEVDFRGVSRAGDLTVGAYVFDAAGAGWPVGPWFKFTPGDVNDDGWVTLADYTVWAANYDPSGDGSLKFWDGDWSNDGKVTLVDYTVWAANYNPPPAASTPAATVPEPACLALLLTGALALLRRRSP